MYCVICGTCLQETNQEGLVCVACKPTQRGQGSKQLVRVEHCFRCGQPYHPQDASIQHLSCSQAQAGMNRSSTHTNARETFQEARRQVYVPVLVFSTQENAGK